MRAFWKYRGDRRAFVTVYLAFAMLTLIPVVGLAIDFTILYNAKARLQQACDAAVIGAGNEVQRSTDVTNQAQNDSLKAAVRRFFDANFTPAPWASSQLNYDSSITQDPATKIRTIYVTATYQVPMLFMRVIHISNSQVAAQAIAKIRFVNLMIVVDRSGSVNRTGSGAKTNPQIIEEDLTSFVGTAATSIFVNGRDVVGLVSFGGNYYLDFAPTASFQTSVPPINTAISKIFFDNNSSTNTGEGLYQAWYQLTQLNQTGALNVILLITDGRPSAFTGSFALAAGSKCVNKSNKNGFLDSSVANPFPPPANRGENGILMVNPPCNMAPPFTAGCEAGTVAPNTDNKCAYYSDPSQVASDITNIPVTIGPLDHTVGPWKSTFTSTSGYYTNSAPLVNNPTAVRYAAFNYAANVATAIRTDAVYSPVIYTVGLNFDTSKYPSEEPLDADFLATLANDPTYKAAGEAGGKYAAGQKVYQAGQTAGRYYDVSYSGLASALSDITSQILRLSAH